MKKRKHDEVNLVEEFGIGGLSAYTTGVLQGYMKGFLAEHRSVRWAKRVLLCTVSLAIVVTAVYMTVPIFSQSKQNADVAMAAEEGTASEAEKEPGEAGAENGKPSLEPESKQDASEPKPEKMPETKKEETMPEPLDDSVMEPSDIYAEKGSKAVFKAYHPRARDYQWEIYDTEAGWIKAAEETVSGYVDELYRNISSMELLADQEQQIRCQITTEEDVPVTYEAKLYLLSGRISDISAETYEADAGKYTSAEDIPVEVVYQDGTKETVTGLNGLCFLDQSESTKRDLTETGNMKEVITTVRTAREYDHIDPGSKEGTLLYQNSKGENVDIPVNIKGIDQTAPKISDFRISEFAVSNVDQEIPVTVTIKATDDITTSGRLVYAFLPEEKEPQETDWHEQSVFQTNIQNGVWKAFCKDEAGNIAAKEQKIVAVDTTAPTIRLILEEREGWCQENRIFVSAEDGLSVEYRYLCEETGEDSGWIIESSKSVEKNGDWKIQVRDAAGNVAEEMISIENIDTQGPVIRNISEKSEGETISNEN